MGLLNGLMGNAGEQNPQAVQQEYAMALGQGEVVEKAYSLIRDMFIFTNRRLLLVDKQGLTGKKVEYHSIPYKSISHFSIETAGHFDLDAELKIYISSATVPIEKRFNKSVNIYELQAVLTAYVARA